MRHCQRFVLAPLFCPWTPQLALAQDAPSSIGTGANPLDSITMGMFGLGGRVRLPAEKLTPVFGFQHTSVRGSNFPEDNFGQRDFTRLGSSSAFFGFRGNGDAPEIGAVNPNGIGGVLTTLQRMDSGDTNRKYHFNGLGLGGMGGVGADAGIADGAAVGVALGGMAAWRHGGVVTFRQLRLQRW